ncbi:MAG: type I glutamate--ammonia ligase [Dehalococcoidia bacterium]
MEPGEIRDFIQQNDIKIVDLKFTDLLGTWQHFSITTDEVTDELFADGIGFDGSSIRAFQGIERSDMNMIPDPSTAVLDPFTSHPTLHMLADIHDPITGDRYHKDPRGVAQRAEEYLKTTGLAETSYWGPACEFFIFDDVRYESGREESYYYLDSIEAAWNTGRDEGPNLAYKTDHKEGYFPAPPRDTLQDLRTEMVLEMQKWGLQVEVHHHEVGTAGQCEIDLRYAPLSLMADSVMIYKYIVRNVARQAGKVATFMPKPIFEDNGSGMHVHQSLWKGDTNLFFDANGYALASQSAMHYIGGLIKHASALMAFCAPTTNSYKRLVPGYEAPTVLVYSARNRSAAIRIPMYSSAPKAKRLEFRSPDPTANPYLAFAAMLLAGLDGIENKLDPGDPVDTDVYELDLVENDYPQVPSSLEGSLAALKDDHEFLLKGGVFSEDLIETWISYKRTNEVDEVRIRPHPHEFHLYFDA